MIYLCFTFILFIFYSFLGWLIEMVYMGIKNRKVINRGFFIGPICPIYGVGGLLLILLLSPYIASPLVVFSLSILIFSVLEYTTSFVMEKLFHARWWDYSEYTFNINGRICLETMIPFGLLGLFVMYILHPFVSMLVWSLSANIIIVLTSILAILFFADVIVSYSIIIKYGIKVKKLHADSTEEITNQIHQEFAKSNNVLKRRLAKAFPHAKPTQKKKGSRAAKKS